jgi:hypothetical protein
VTYPDSSSAAAERTNPRLAIRVFDTRTRKSCFIKTDDASESFNDSAALGWMGNDLIVLAMSPDRTFAWQLRDDAGFTAAEAFVDEAVRSRAAELLAAPRPSQQFVIPPSLLQLPEEIAPANGDAARPTKNPTLPSAPTQDTGSAR